MVIFLNLLGFFLVFLVFLLVMMSISVQREADRLDCMVAATILSLIATFFSLF